jgi:hypothetical protein
LETNESSPLQAAFEIERDLLSDPQQEQFTFLDENGAINFGKLGYAAQRYMAHNPQDAKSINSFMLWVAHNVNRECQRRLDKIRNKPQP